MNEKNLHELIERYEDKFYFFNDDDHNEIFKWKAVQHFRSVWFSENKFSDFAAMFKEAKRESSVLIDNSQVSPTNGIVKLAERYPDEVESLFRRVLFSDDGGDIDLKQEHMELFLDEIEKLRQKDFPAYYKYKQDRHAASCYMAFFDPEHNYIYRYSEAEELAKNTEFGMDIGSGENFVLKNYYALCDSVVEALKQHQSLLKKHFDLIKNDDDYYMDKSLHLLAFDFMYCCRNYNLYYGIKHQSKQESIKTYRLNELRAKEEADRQKRIMDIKENIRSLEISIEHIKEISLIDVEVSHKTYGTGTVIKQDINTVTVRFDGFEKTFVIHKKYALRPTFENDKETVEAFSVYGDTVDKINALQNEMNRLMK